MKKKIYILCTKILWMNFSHRIENINKNKKFKRKGAFKILIQIPILIKIKNMNNKKKTFFR